MTDKKFLPCNILERIRDLLKGRKMAQAELAARIGSMKNTISRFMSKKTNKFSDKNIVKIAEVFGVSTDFILGVTELPDRKNYDISELGLFSLAAKISIRAKPMQRLSVAFWRTSILPAMTKENSIIFFTVSPSTRKMKNTRLSMTA